MKARIAPSILSADFANLEAELASISHADLIHVDVMDGHFVPNLTLGVPVVKRISEVTSVPLDVHLMIEAPEKWVSQYAQYAGSVTFHYEAATDPRLAISEIRKISTQNTRGYSGLHEFSLSTYAIKQETWHLCHEHEAKVVRCEEIHLN